MTRGAVLALPAMLAGLEELVRCESFSADHAAVARSAEVVGALGTRLLGAGPETIVIDGVAHLRWTFGSPRVLLVGHHDTVWPLGSLQTHPWSVADGIARGPGVLDMKAGLVQMFHALGSLPSPAGVCVLVNGDEEVGSPTSRELIEDSARGCAAAFVLESAANAEGALKTARKGTSQYEVVVHGRAAHAGQEPQKGINAAVEAAHQVLAVADLGASLGTTATTCPVLGAPTITPTLLAPAALSIRCPRWRKYRWTFACPPRRRRTGSTLSCRGSPPGRPEPGWRYWAAGNGRPWNRSPPPNSSSSPPKSPRNSARSRRGESPSAAPRTATTPRPWAAQRWTD